SFVNEAGFRFKHILVRDAAYQTTAKKVRAGLHERYARWLARAAGDRVTEYAEILGYHLEQSFRYRLELGPADAAAEALAARAAAHLTAAGPRARNRDDRMGAVALLTRAAGLQPSRRLGLLPVIGDILRQTDDYSRSAELLDEAIETARQQGEEAIETVSTLLRAHVAFLTGEVTFTEMAAEADRVVTVLERVGDDAQLALALETAARQRMFLGRAAEATILGERALQHAERAGDDHRARHCVRVICVTRAWGPAPVSEALAFLKRFSAERRTLLTPENAPSVLAAMVGAYSGRFAEARQVLTEARVRARELPDYQRAYARLPQLLGTVELLAGNPAEAELVLREGYDHLGEIGEQNSRASIATLLADALMRQGRDEDASEMLAVADDISQHDDYDAQVRMRAVRAQILARRGELAQADQLAREAVEIVTR